MDRKTIIILSLISALVSLIYILLSNYGLLRYVYIYINSIENYTQNYNKLPNMGGKNRTIISINNVYTNKNDIIKNTKKTLKSLLDQTTKLNLISIVLHKSKQTEFPQNMKSAMQVFNCSKDMKQLNCLITSINRELESTTRIITLSNDTIYGKDFIEELLGMTEKHKNSIIYNNNKDVIDLNKGAVFYTDFFSKDFFDVPSDTNSEDWVNTYFKNFPKKRINYKENYKIL